MRHQFPRRTTAYHQFPEVTNQEEKNDDYDPLLKNRPRIMKKKVTIMIRAPVVTTELDEEEDDANNGVDGRKMEIYMERKMRTQSL
ncbi:hypothetical protein L1987_16051 [Smallanthus sonchifolius]|uniref:Uncharacterized protein n=1 Tax=Smallanthus sonchifolius TaxID=185202 RepID=A0ACB9J8T5_9ASTR|nr:hypothetical protein L1987_16051 [Smallanthus sonchifolius]